jgi:hypothetical protein
MSKSIKALVTIKYQWVRNAGLDHLLLILADNKNASLSGMLILPVTSYNTSDQWFLEVAFSNAYLELQGTLFVPKSEVVAIVKTDDPEDLHKVGYKGHSQSEPLVCQGRPLGSGTPAGQLPDASVTPAAIARTVRAQCAVNPDQNSLS